MAREVHEPDYDLSTQNLDGEVIMRVGGGKKHGQYWIGVNTLDTTTTPTTTKFIFRGGWHRFSETGNHNRLGSIVTVNVIFTEAVWCPPR